MRLFTGISIPPSVLATLAEVLTRLYPTATLKWSPLENLHITVRFIGAWPEARLSELTAALHALPPTGNIHLDISRFGFLPHSRRPRNFFAGVDADPKLALLVRETNSALAGLGVPAEERAYMPHLTLARIKNEDIRSLRDRIAAMTNLNFGSFQATHFHLYLSEPAPGRSPAPADPNGTSSVYSILQTFPLAGSPA